MADGPPSNPSFSFEQIAAAAQQTRFALLSLGDRWFSAREAGDVIGVTRGTVREHTPMLEALDLLERRDSPGRPRPVGLWRVTPIGTALHNALEHLVGRPLAPVPRRQAREPAALLAIHGSERDTAQLVEELLARPSTTTGAVPGYWVDTTSDPG